MPDGIPRIAGNTRWGRSNGSAGPHQVVRTLTAGGTCSRSVRPSRSTYDPTTEPGNASRTLGLHRASDLFLPRRRAGEQWLSRETGVSNPCCSVLGIGESTNRNADRAAELIDELRLQHQEPPDPTRPGHPTAGQRLACPERADWPTGATAPRSDRLPPSADPRDGPRR